MMASPSISRASYLGALLFLTIPNALQAINYTWLGGGNEGNGVRWNDTTHWSPNTGTPGSSDTVLIANSSSTSKLDLQANRTILQLDLQRTTTFQIEGGILTATTVNVSTGTSTTFQNGLTATNLNGSGTLTGTVTVSGTHSVGGANTAGTQTLTNGVTYSSGSVFSWDLSVATPSSTTSATTYDKVVGVAAGTSATFAIVLAAGQSFSDAYWNVSHTWTDIFSSGTNLATVFTAFGGSVAANGVVNGEGAFTRSGNTLTWNAIPEPSTALAGLLLTAGLLHRRRSVSSPRLA